MSDKMIRTELIVHDLKVPLAVIDAGAKLLLEQQDLYGPLTEKQIKVLKRILRSSQNAAGLVNDVLEDGRARQGAEAMSVDEIRVSSLVTSLLMEMFDLVDPGLSENIAAAGTFKEIESISGRSGVLLEFTETLWVKKIRLDQGKTKQVLRNILLNAFKYRNRIVKITGTIKDSYLIFAVQDDGKGIPESEQSRLFSRYCQPGQPSCDMLDSHGLGLSGVQLLLGDMGGALELESDKEKGACFTVSIPLKI